MRNVLAVLAGVVIGAIVNGLLITISPSLIPPPAGVDVTDPESLRQSIHLFEAKHFVMPLLAHALGTLAGALAGYLIATTYRVRIAYAIGLLFLCGGILASTMIPAPAAFIAVDLIAAYLPMSWLAVQIGRRIRPAGLKQE